MLVHVFFFFSLLFHLKLKHLIAHFAQCLWSKAKQWQSWLKGLSLWGNTPVQSTFAQWLWLESWTWGECQSCDIPLCARSADIVRSEAGDGGVNATDKYVAFDLHSGQKHHLSLGFSPRFSEQNPWGLGLNWFCFSWVHALPCLRKGNFTAGQESSSGVRGITIMYSPCVGGHYGGPGKLESIQSRRSPIILPCSELNKCVHPLHCCCCC